jgi:hypothetical protein
LDPAIIARTHFGAYGNHERGNSVNAEDQKLLEWYLFDRPGAEVFDITRLPGETNEELKARIDGMGIFEKKRPS